MNASAATTAHERTQENNTNVIEKPKRPLSAYNLFFQQERQRLLADPQHNGKMSFAEMGKTIAAKWKVIDPEAKAGFETLAKADRLRYKKRIGEWKKMIKTSTKLQHQQLNARQKSGSSGIDTLQENQGDAPAPDAQEAWAAQSEASLPTTMAASHDQTIKATGGTSTPALSLGFDRQLPSLYYLQHQQMLQSGGALSWPEHNGETEPLPRYLSNLRRHKGIEHLARKMERECVDLFINLFR